MTGYQLYWRLAARGVLTVELAAACARYQERVGRAATRLEVHPGEVVSAPGLVVTESRAVARGCWLIGDGE